MEKSTKFLVEQCQKVSITNVVRQARSQATRLKLQGNIEALGQVLGVTTTPCHFGGRRHWFVCPGCRRRVGALYQPPTNTPLLCRHCHQLRYLKGRYHRMLGE